MTEQVDLVEYGWSRPVPLTDFDLALLQTVKTWQLRAVPSTRAGWFQFQAGSHIGTVELDSVSIRVRPKIDDLRNVLMMFGAAAGIVHWKPRLSTYGHHDLVDGVAELVLRTIDNATRRGLIHGYQNQEDRLETIRGRILVTELASRPWDAWPVPCRYDEFSPDIAENRVLRAAVDVMERWGLEPELRRLVRELQARFEDVTLAPPIIEYQRIRPSPVNEHYWTALALSRQVLEGSGVALTEGSTGAVSFLVDMNLLFERWIGRELERRLWPDIGVLGQEGVLLSTDRSVDMRPDLMFTSGGKTVLVGDIKYKLTGTGMARNPDYYQLLAYTVATDLPAGILVYCQSDEAPPRTITVRNGGQRLTCYPLPLAGDWGKITAQLEVLSNTVRQLSHARAMA